MLRVFVSGDLRLEKGEDVLSVEVGVGVGIVEAAAPLPLTTVVVVFEPAPTGVVPAGVLDLLVAVGVVLTAVVDPAAVVVAAATKPGVQVANAADSEV